MEVLEFMFKRTKKSISSEAIQEIDEGNLPKHIAIIMDGNGRWARKRGLPRIAGHKAGVEALRDIIKCASDIGVQYLTLYAFSTEIGIDLTKRLMALWNY